MKQPPMWPARTRPRLPGLPVLAAFAVVTLAGCAGGKVTQLTQYHAQPTRADAVYVYDFDITPTQVATERGLFAKRGAGATPLQPDAAQAKLAMQVQDEVANAIVQHLQAQHVRAIRSWVAAPAGQNVLLVKGRFDTVDSGDRTRRILIGLGAGKSQVSASVQVWYRPAAGAPQLLQTCQASADSGHMPGMAETVGLGAAAGHLVVSAATGAGLHTVAETTRAPALDDAGRMGASIAKQVAQIAAVPAGL